MPKYKVRIDRDECTMCAICWETCPDFFESNPDDNMSQVVERYRIGGDISLGEASEDLIDDIRESAEECPVQIIHVE